MPNENSIDITVTVMMRTDKRREESRKERRYDDEEPTYHPKIAHHGPERARTGFMRRRDDLRSEKQSGMSHEEAMNALLKATKKTQTFLSQFKDDFDEDICSIKSYAHPDLINELWCNKIENSDQHHHSGRTGRQDQEPLKLQDVARGFFRSLKLAVSSTNPKSDPAVARKLHLANDDMGQLLQDVAFDFRLVNRIMTELEMLTVFLGRNGARAGSCGDKNASERRQKRPSRRGESGERQQSRRGSDGHQNDDDDRGDSCSEGRGSVDGSETDDRDRDQEGRPDTEDQDDA